MSNYPILIALMLIGLTLIILINFAALMRQTMRAERFEAALSRVESEIKRPLTITNTIESNDSAEVYRLCRDAIRQGMTLNEARSVYRLPPAPYPPHDDDEPVEDA